MKLSDLKNFRDFFWNLPLVKASLDWTQQHSLPGFFKVPIYDVLVFLFNEVRRFDLLTRANSIAFSFFLALFPSIIVIFTLVPYFADYILSFFNFTTQNFLDVLQNEIRQVLPGEKGVGTLLFDTISDLATTERAGLLSFGFALAIFFASNGMLSMMRSFEKSHLTTFKKRHPLKKRGIAILLTLQVGFLLIVSVFLIILGREIIGWLSEYIRGAGFSTVGIYIIRWVAILSLFYISIAIIYRYGAATYRKFSIFSPGATLATILSIISSVAFSFYVDNYGAYNRIYGPIGTIMVVMLWIQLNALVLLIGFELNASIAVNRDLKEELPDEELEE